MNNEKSKECYTFVSEIRNFSPKNWLKINSASAHRTEIDLKNGSHLVRGFLQVSRPYQIRLIFNYFSFSNEKYFNTMDATTCANFNVNGLSLEFVHKFFPLKSLNASENGVVIGKSSISGHFKMNIITKWIWTAGTYFSCHFTIPVYPVILAQFLPSIS